MSAYKFSDDDTKNANTYRNSVTGTPHYLAPEIGDLECDEFNQQVYDDKIDSWAFGITLFEISNFYLYEFFQRDGKIHCDLKCLFDISVANTKIFTRRL